MHVFGGNSNTRRQNMETPHRNNPAGEWFQTQDQDGTILFKKGNAIRDP